LEEENGIAKKIFGLFVLQISFKTAAKVMYCAKSAYRYSRIWLISHGKTGQPGQKKALTSVETLIIINIQTSTAIKNKSQNQ
jgi:hypothetical protein